MKNHALSLAFAGLLSFVAMGTPAQARPPTVTNSPGYDARLAESRKAWAASQAVQPAPKVILPKGRKKKRTVPTVP